MIILVVCNWCKKSFASQGNSTTCDKCKRDCTCNVTMLSQMACKVHGVSAQLNRTQME